MTSFQQLRNGFDYSMGGELAVYHVPWIVKDYLHFWVGDPILYLTLGPPSV